MFTVNMFGKFQIATNDIALNNDNIRSDMMVKLLSFIIVNRERTLTVDELAEVLWQEDESDNPSGALKNLMYRLRTVLCKSFGEGDFIITGRGSYCWNQDYQVKVDVEEFEQFCEEARNKRFEVEQRIDYYERAINLYQGDFLAKYSSMYWIVPLSAYYHSMFLSAVKKLAALYIETKQYEKMEKICTNALRFDSVDERLHCLLIRSMIYQNKLELATEYYERAEKLLYSTLGIRKSIQLKDVFEELTKMKKDVKAEAIHEVNQDMTENDNPDGAYICGYPIFREIYRLESRRIARLGLSEYVLLMTVSLAKNIEKTGNDKIIHYQIDKTMESLEETLKESLRIGDVAARYSDSQYVVLLPTLDYEDSVKVTDRIVSNLYKKLRNRRIQVKSDISEISVVESMGGFRTYEYS